MVVSLVATTEPNLLHLQQLLRPHQARLLPETTAGAVRTLAEQRVTLRELMEVAAPLTGKSAISSILVSLLTFTVTAEAPMVIVLSRTVAKTAARMALLSARHPPLSLPLVPPRSLPLASLFLVSPRARPTLSQLVCRLLMEAVVPSLVTQFAVPGLKAPVVPCTVTVVTPQPTAVRDVKTVLAPKRLVRPLPQLVPLLLRQSLVLSRSRVVPVCLLCMLV